MKVARLYQLEFYNDCAVLVSLDGSAPKSEGRFQYNPETSSYLKTTQLILVYLANRDEELVSLTFAGNLPKTEIPHFIIATQSWW